MPSQAITTTPTALAGITSGTNYTLQNRSPGAVYLQVDSTAPTDATGAFVMSPAPGSSSAGIAKADSGDSIYVWGDRNGGLMVYDEAP